MWSSAPRAPLPARHSRWALTISVSLSNFTHLIFDKLVVVLKISVLVASAHLLLASSGILNLSIPNDLQCLQAASSVDTRFVSPVKLRFHDILRIYLSYQPHSHRTLHHTTQQQARPATSASPTIKPDRLGSDIFWNIFIAFASFTYIFFHKSIKRHQYAPTRPNYDYSHSGRHRAVGSWSTTQTPRGSTEARI